MFINREKEIVRLQQALSRETPQLIAVYGRRRCGKSTLLRHILTDDAIYFAADLRESPLQIAALAQQIDKALPGFSKAIYPDWETILSSLNQSLRQRTSLCIDEFPYLVKHSPELPSVIQKIVDSNARQNLNIILCGSAQQMMHGMALESSSPLFGRCNEVLRIEPMKICHMARYLNVSAVEAVKEFAVWGGVPRYWEIRKQEDSFQQALKHHVLDQYGILYEESERLFADEMRTSVQAFSVLSLIGSGCHRTSEIAGRLGKPATQLSRLLAFLTELGYIRREIPFGESIRSTKKSLYKLNDSFLNFYFTFLVPNKSRLEYGLVDQVWKELSGQLDNYLSGQWETICRSAIPFMEIEGKRFNPAARWWGSGINGKPMEIDLIAGSTDKSTLLVGEVKWSKKDSAAEINRLLDHKISNMPFVREQRVIKAIFLKNKAATTFQDSLIFDPGDVIQAIGDGEDSRQTKGSTFDVRSSRLKK
ncbi:MAG: ATP-binding protein [Candidatus Aminicenantes bacterium]|nr:ATP-binding protein [Candidatus Aminicenantes bacterium]